MATKVGTKYQYKHDVNPETELLCGRTGINKKVKDLTDADVEKMIEKGNKNFEQVPKPAKDK